MKGIYGVRKRIISGIIALMTVVSLLPVSASAESECTEHSFGEWTVVSEADCTEAGVETRKCESCGLTEKCQTPALGHVYILGKCSRCGLEDASYIEPPVLRITTASGHPKLSWDAVDGVYKYWVYRSTDGVSFKYYDRTSKTSYTNTSTEIGTTYWYKVKAVRLVEGKDQASDYSEAISMQCRPAAPSLSITRSNGKPKLSWKAVDGAVKYWVYRSTDGVSFKYWDTTTRTQYINTGAQFSTTYYYRVKAVNGANVVSGFSSTRSILTALAAPTVSITTVGGRPYITWDAVAGANGYYVFRSVDGKSYSYQGYTTKTSFTNTDYEVGKVYYYKVKADNSELDTLTGDALDGTAAKLVAQARAWLGCKEADGSNKEIIDIYNGRKPLPRGYKLGYTEAWCAAFVSACAIKTGMADIIPQECGCGSMVRLFKQLDSWDESDARIPNPGDIIFFDWDDNGYGDNTGFPGHVGIVEKVVGSTVTVIDGNNKDDAVGRRTIEINGRFIRGYGVPKYKPSPSSQVRSDYSNAVSVRAETSAPIVNITTCAGKPRIYWNSQGSMTKYWIYRSTDGVNFSYYDTTTKTSYTNASTDIGTTCYYKVKAVTAQKDKTVISDYSDIVSIQCRLAAPTVSITSSTSGKPKLSWKAIDGADKYYVYRSTDGENFAYWDSTVNLTYINSGAVKDTKYYYKVKAVSTANSGINSAQSSEVSITAKK